MQVLAENETTARVRGGGLGEGWKVQAARMLYDDRALPDPYTTMLLIDRF